MAERWWEHERFDVCNTFPFRMGFSLLVISPFAEVMYCGFSGHRGWLALGFAQVVAWMVGIFAIMLRDDLIRNKARRVAWGDYEDEVRRRWDEQ